MWAAVVKVKKDIPLHGAKGYVDGKPSNFCDIVVPKDTEITITHGKNEQFAFWGYGWIWDLPDEYIGETVKIISHE